MDPRNTLGFLKTGASLASDVNLLAYVFLIVPGMLLGFSFARRKVFIYHQITMTSVVIINWILIGYIMISSYTVGVLPNIPAKLNQPFYTLPTVHLLFGGTAQIIGTILAIEMLLGPLMPFRLEPIKNWMRLTLSLWLITATLGVLTYLTFYGVPLIKRNAPPPTGDGSIVSTPEATPDSSSPVVTPDASGSITIIMTAR